MNKLVFCGPSGAGKGTMISRLLTEYPERFQTSVSHTTRAPRPGETDGVSYHFVSVATFQALQAADAFADAISLYGNLYGTLRDQASNGKTVIYERDSRGVVAMAGLPGVTTVYVRPPSLTVLEQRLRARGTETDAQIADRLATAVTEMTFLDASPLVTLVVCNDCLELAYGKLISVIFSKNGWL
jgi:guanylate kinase